MRVIAAGFAFSLGCLAMPDYLQALSKRGSVRALVRRIGSAEQLRIYQILETCGLGEAQEAYRKVAAGSAGRVVLRPQE
jgi:hypothetical protein